MSRFINCAINCYRNVSKFGGSGIASFTQYQTIMDIFKSAPEFDADGWYFKDPFGNKVLCNNQYLRFDAINDKCDTGITALESHAMVIKGIIYPATAARYTGAYSATGRFMIGRGPTGTASTKITIGYGNISTAAAGVSNITIVNEYRTYLLYKAKLWVLPVETDTSPANILNIINTVTPDFNAGAYTFSDSSNYIINTFPTSPHYMGMNLLEFAVVNIDGETATDVIRVNGSQQCGNALYDENTGAAYAITGHTESTFYNNIVAVGQPKIYTVGATIFKRTADNAYLALVGNHSETLTGYTKEAYFAPGSGILKYLSNTYTFANTDPQVVSLIPNDNFTYAELDAIVNTKYISIIKDDGGINSIVLKKNSELDFESVYDGIMNNFIELSTGVISTNSVYDFEYTGTALQIKIYSDNPVSKYVSLLVNGVFNQKLTYVDDEYMIVSLPAGTKNIRILTGSCSKPNTVVKNTRIIDIKGIKANFTKQTNNLADKIVMLCDSIGVGQAADNYNYTSFASKIMYNGLADVIHYGYGYGRIKDFAETSGKIETTIANITDAFTNTGRKIVLIQAGTNDYGLDSTASATFLGWYLDLVQAIKATDAEIEIYCFSPLHRNGETSLLTDYSTGIGTICTTESVTHISGFDIMVWNATNFGDDAVHPNQIGMDLIYDELISVIFPT